MVETFLVGAACVRQLVHDPRLPEAILDPAPRRLLVEATRSYDELGRRQWAPFLAGHGVPHHGGSGAGRATLGPLAGSALMTEEAP